MSEQEIIAPKPTNPIDIAPERVKIYSQLHRCSPQEAFGAMLAKDLLERLVKAATVDDMKVIVKVLVTSVIGDGNPPERVRV